MTSQGGRTAEGFNRVLTIFSFTPLTALYHVGCAHSEMRDLTHFPAEPPLAGAESGGETPPLLLCATPVLIREDSLDAIRQQTSLNLSVIDSSIGHYSGTELITT